MIGEESIEIVNEHVELKRKRIYMLVTAAFNRNKCIIVNIIPFETDYDAIEAKKNKSEFNKKNNYISWIEQNFLHKKGNIK